MSDIIDNWNGFSFSIDVYVEGPDEDVGIFGFAYEATFDRRLNKETGQWEDDFDVVDAQAVADCYGDDWRDRLDAIKGEILEEFEQKAADEVEGR